MLRTTTSRPAHPDHTSPANVVDRNDPVEKQKEQGQTIARKLRETRIVSAVGPCGARMWLPCTRCSVPSSGISNHPIQGVARLPSCHALPDWLRPNSVGLAHAPWPPILRRQKCASSTQRSVMAVSNLRA
jgi:hypothetical protein